MIKKFTISFCLCASVLISSAAPVHFITDTSYRQLVQNDFNKKMKLMGMKFYNTKNILPTAEEKEALTFLYAYMPMADITDYSTSYYLENIRSSFQAKKEMSWGKIVPELLYRHFVLPVRVNNENLDHSRVQFYKELKKRVQGMSMKDAILEVNHWCHEKVTYTPSDARTSSPLASN